MTIFRILLFSFLSALFLYIPFYYFAPIYHPLYVHVPPEDVNWWARVFFREENGGIQLYIAFVLMFLALGLTSFFEFVYLKFNSQTRWGALAVGSLGSIIYLWTIGFFPPMEQVRTDGQGVLFIALAVIISFLLSQLHDRKAGRWLLLLLLFIICMVPQMWAYFRLDYFYFFAPALRTLKGFALNQSYFQYDYLISFLAMAWMKFGLPADRFLNLLDLTYFVFFVGAYYLAKNLFFNKKLAVYFILSLVLIKVYGNMGDPSCGPQVSPLRLDLWLLVLGLAYWKAPQHWLVGITLGFLLAFHHAFGMIYSISYVLFIFSTLVLNFKNETIKAYLPNACWMLGGMLVYHFFISPHNSVPAMDYEKYNIGFIPINPKSLFWYVPVVTSILALLLWKSKDQVSQRYLQAGLFLILLAIGNLLYFFGRGHDNNLINISASPWLLFFMLIDLVIHRWHQRFSTHAKNVLISLVGVLLIGLTAFFYSGTAVDRIKAQLSNFSQIADLFNAKSKIDLDLRSVRAVTQGNPNIVFLTTNHDFEYYYYGGYVPAEFCPIATQLFLFPLTDTLNKRLANGADIIVPDNEFDAMQENIILLNAKYTYKISDFVLVTNNKPAMQ